MSDTIVATMPPLPRPQIAITPTPIPSAPARDRSKAKKVEQPPPARRWLTLTDPPRV